MESDLVYLAQTDTTVGFLSANSLKLASIKNRPESKKFILSISDLQTLSSIARVPKRYRPSVRYAKKTTYILPSRELSFRIIPKEHPHHALVNKYKMLYSTSANKAGEGYDQSFAFDSCDVVLLEQRGLSQMKPSRILLLGKRSVKKVRS